MGDEIRLRQVLSNLLTNAVKFTESGTVTLRIRRSADDEGLLLFSVTDTGVGIAAGDLSTIFRPFTQVSDRNRHEGAGLGLTIANQLVGLMGGELQVESELNQGSRFWFEVHLESDDSEATNIQQSEENSLRCDNLRVLVAEDHPLNRSIVVDMLTSAGALVTEATNGQEAVDACQSQRFDLIVIDCQMPELSGPAAIRRIRDEQNLNSRSAIILLTAYDLEIAGNAEYSGVDRCLTKPIDGPALIRNAVELVADSVRQASRNHN